MVTRRNDVVLCLLSIATTRKVVKPACIIVSIASGNTTVCDAETNRCLGLATVVWPYGETCTVVLRKCYRVSGG